ncbi:hypothetical protein QTP86_008113 [Hemibagrus guttatus]|nr:hypothetical protein QTP86_008113 [Hemibagrus guttatus]
MPLSKAVWFGVCAISMCKLGVILFGSLLAFKPLHPRNVKLTSVEKGLKVTWDPPNELDGRPVDRYSIGYGKSMRSLRFIKVDKDRRSEVLEDVGGELVKLDGFAVEGGSSSNTSTPGRSSSGRSSKISHHTPVQRSGVLRQRAPQSSSGPEAPSRGGYLPIRSQNKHRVDLSQPQADQRNANKPKLASESIYVVSLQAQKAPQRTVPASKSVNTESPPPEHDEVEEVEDVTVRILSPQSVVITWVDPLVKKEKSFPEGTRQYAVRYREKGESARWEYKETSQKRLVIEKLSADGMYEFSVRITQGDQQGKWSVSVFQRTPESAPAGPPENFEVKPLRGKGTAVTATWDPPDEPNGKIREYILSYAPALKPFGAKSVTYRGTTTSATIDGLTPGDRYIFKIRAANRKGQGPQSKTLSVAMPGIKNGRPNLTATNGKIASTTNENTKGNGVKYITGPDGTRWVVDLDKGVLMNEEGKVLQDSRGRPRKVVIGEDGKTIFDEEGTPLVNQEGMALFGHGRDSRPVVNPKDKYLTVGGKPLVGLDRPTPSTTTTTTTTTATTTTTTTTTTTAEPTTTEITTLEYTTEALPTCPPGTFAKLDKNGVPVMDDYGILDCYPSDEFLMETTMIHTTTQLPPTTHTPTTEFRLFNNSPSSEFDAAGKKRFTAPYVNYIQKDPGAPCSLTEALEYLQVDVLADLIEKDSATASQKQPPKYKPHNITVIAMEGCHSFVILDWARPLKDDMVESFKECKSTPKYSFRQSIKGFYEKGSYCMGFILYYFRVQAKNVFGLGPISETISYVTESDDPLLIERPPETFYSIADSFGNGEDHCQFVDSHMDGRTGPQTLSTYLPQAQGYYRSYRQEPVNFGPIGRRTAHQFVGWYECGVPIPGKW